MITIWLRNLPGWPMHTVCLPRTTSSLARQREYVHVSKVGIMDGQVASYRSPPPIADDFEFIARRMQHMDVPADYDLGGAAPCPGYSGPIVEDVHHIGRRLRELEAPRSRLPPPAERPEAAGEWCC